MYGWSAFEQKPAPSLDAGWIRARVNKTQKSSGSDSPRTRPRCRSQFNHRGGEAAADVGWTKIKVAGAMALKLEPQDATRSSAAGTDHRSRSSVFHESAGRELQYGLAGGGDFDQRPRRGDCRLVGGTPTSGAQAGGLPPRSDIGSPGRCAIHSEHQSTRPPLISNRPHAGFRVHAIVLKPRAQPYFQLKLAIVPRSC